MTLYLFFNILNSFESEPQGTQGICGTTEVSTPALELKLAFETTIGSC